MAERWFYRDPDIVQGMADYLRLYGKPRCILCVGTPGIMGDRLGPTVGSLLRGMSVSIPVYGTVEKPVHGLNLREWVKHTRRMSPVLVIDSAVSRKHRVGTICAGRGKVKARSGIDDNDHIPVGDLYITGVVAEEQGISLLNLIAVNSCPAEIVEGMAQRIAEVLAYAFGGTYSAVSR